MEKSWYVKHWQEVVEFCYQSWNFTNFAPELYQICSFLPALGILSINVERPHFPTFFAKRPECKVKKRWSWKIKKIVKSVRTLWKNRIKSALSH